MLYLKMLQRIPSYDRIDKNQAGLRMYTCIQLKDRMTTDGFKSALTRGQAHA